MSPVRSRVPHLAVATALVLCRSNKTANRCRPFSNESTEYAAAEAQEPFPPLFISLLKMSCLRVRIVPALEVKMCIGHLGSPVSPQPGETRRVIDPYQLPSFASLIKLLQGKT